MILKDCQQFLLKHQRQRCRIFNARQRDVFKWVILQKILCILHYWCIQDRYTYSGLRKNLKSRLSFGQAALKFCLARATSCSSQLMISLENDLLKPLPIGQVNLQSYLPQPLYFIQCIYYILMRGGLGAYSIPIKGGGQWALTEFHII